MFSMFPSRNFKEQFYSYSVAMLPGNERDDVDRGGKIIMPPSSLEWLSRLNVTYPMMFKLTNEKTKRSSHCGVLEFIADEGKVYLPNWLMRNLMLEEGDVLDVEYTTLPVATFSRFKPQSVDFLDIHNPKAVLENTLRQFACLTTGDMINIRYNDRNYELFVMETMPGEAVSIIECDMNVDFAPPDGYEENYEIPKSEEVKETAEVEEISFSAFTGQGYRLDGKQKKENDPDINKERVIPTQRGVPDFDWKPGLLTFMRNSKPAGPKSSTEKKSDPNFKAFGSVGYSMYEFSDSEEDL